MQQFLPPTPLPTYWSLMSGNELSFNYITIKCPDRLVFQRLYDLDALKQEIFKVFFFWGGECVKINLSLAERYAKQMNRDFSSLISEAVETTGAQHPGIICPKGPTELISLWSVTTL